MLFSVLRSLMNFDSLDTTGIIINHLRFAELGHYPNLAREKWKKNL